MANEKKGNWFARHKFLSIVLGIILLIIIVSAAGSGGNKPASDTAKTTSGSTTKKADKKATVVKIGQPVRDGKFEFTITSIKCGVPSVGSDEFSTKNAQGQYCLLNTSVKNIGNEAQTLDASNQYLFDGQGKKYSADSEASMDANPSGSTFLEQINPGNAVSGQFVFDVPKGVTPVSAELHDSAFSDGVKVSLK